MADDHTAHLPEWSWLQRVALRLAQPDEADDLAQEAAIAAWRADDSRCRSRGWLGQVLRNHRRLRWRTDNRRKQRELAAAALIEP